MHQYRERISDLEQLVASVFGLKAEGAIRFAMKISFDKESPYNQSVRPKSDRMRRGVAMI